MPDNNSISCFVETTCVLFLIRVFLVRRCVRLHIPSIIEVMRAGVATQMT